MELRKGVGDLISGQQIVSTTLGTRMDLGVFPNWEVPLQGLAFLCLLGQVPTPHPTWFILGQQAEA